MKKKSEIAGVVEDWIIIYNYILSYNYTLLIKSGIKPPKNQKIKIYFDF